jgi:hypothetical protein
MDSDTRRKLVGMLGRLGSNADGEVVTAARLIEGWRKKLNLQWDDIIASPPAPSGARQQPRPPPPRPQRQKPGAGGHDFNDAGSSAGERVSDHYAAAEYEDLLDRASDGVRTPKEYAFVEDMRERFERFGAAAYLSVGQKAWLETLGART